MIELGKIQTLEVIKTTDFGVYLSSDSKDKVLLPKSQVPNGTKIGDRIEVFIYKDSEDRLIATTTTPALTLGEVALLKVIDVGSIGAFLEWGLVKDLLLPFKEQTSRVHVNYQVLVSLYIDKSERLCATMKVYDYLESSSSYKAGDKVMAVIYEIKEEYGAFAAVDNKYSALIPNKELFKEIKPGDSIEARVTSVRDDGKLNLSLREEVHVQMDSDASIILDTLKNNDGYLPYNDKTDPEIIKKEFGLSKNAFKRAIGKLFKERVITILDDGIRLN